jgi:hypothetical protein
MVSICDRDATVVFPEDDLSIQIILAFFVFTVVYHIKEVKVS